jgi:hypothetical protein
MKRSLYVLLGTVLLMSGLATTVFAQAELALSAESIHFSQSTFLEGKSVRIYATIQNSSNMDLLGTVQFYDESSNAQIGSDQTISIFAHKTDDVFIDWTPYFEGDHSILISIDPWKAEEDDPSNNSARKVVNVLKDTDHDRIPDSQDPDDDNDGVIDEEDAFPENAYEWVDTDGDRIGDNEDGDDDNDSHLDIDDSFPFNPLEWDDVDEDGIGNNEDTDDDNDGLLDEKEEFAKTDPLNPDTDEDGVLDGKDAFPLDANEQYDYDKDLIGDNADDDDDNDGLLDETDSHDNNKGPIIKVDGNTGLAFLNRKIHLDASPSYDEDGEITEIQWIVKDGETQSGDTLEYLVLNKEFLEISVAVIDDAGEIRKTSFNIKVFNIDFYLVGAMIWIIIILAILIFLKYSSRAEKI